MLYLTFEPEHAKVIDNEQVVGRLKEVYKSAYQEDERSYVKIDHFLNRPEYKFERDRKKSGMVYWIKERQEGDKKQENVENV